MNHSIFLAARRAVVDVVLAAGCVVGSGSLISTAAVAAPDDFDAYRRQQEQGVRAVKKEFQEFKEKQDREFADVLKSQWRDFDTFQGKVRIKEPKPKVVPVVAPPSVKPSLVPVEPTPEVRPVGPVKPVVSPPPPVQPPPKPVAADALQLEFFGNKVSFPFDSRWKTYRIPAGDKPAAMSAFWAMMSGSKYEPTVAAMSTVRRDLKLDDWGYVALWRDVARSLQAGKAEQNLLLWYFLVKSGIDVRLGYSGADVHLFVAVKQQVYSTKFTSVGKQTYYAVLASDRGDSIGAFYTYEANYPIKLQPLDLGAASTSFTRTVSAQRALAFEYQGKTITLNIPYDRRLVQYLADYPQSEFDVYFATDGSSLVRRSLLAELKKYTASMDEEEAVNFLLTFVQKAFPYKTDEDQFGYEKYFFVEESLHFPYNDCEDRSVIFAWLMHELLGVKTVGLLYPGHMTTAVALKQVKSGFSTIDYRGARFVIADPTYIGATVGMAMPSYERIKPDRVVEIR